MATVKIAFRGDIRRVTVTDFASLLVHVANAYNIEDFVMKYTDDDGDRVSVASAEGFEEAVKSTKGEKILKLLVFLPKSQQDRKENQENHAPNGNEEVEQENKAPESESVSSPPPVSRDPLDHGVDCQGCSKRLIGTMYQCTVCPNVAVCPDCEEKNVHNAQHTLLKVRVPLSQKKARKWDCKQNDGNKEKWKGHNFKMFYKFRRLIFPFIFIAIIRSLSVPLCLAGLWAVHRIMKKKNNHLKVCSECTHNEGCRVGKKAARVAKEEKCQGLIPKILLVILCLVLRALPCWFLVLCSPFAFILCRILCRLRRGCREGFRADAFGNYRDIFQLNGAQLFQRVQQNTQRRHPRGVPQSVMGCAAVAASESLAASVAAVVALGESVAAELGAHIPVALPVNAPAYPEQLQTLKEMGFEDTPLLHKLLAKHSGNIPAVVSQITQLKSRK